MALLDILGGLANLAQGDIGGFVSGLKQNSAHSKEEKALQTKRDMASKLMSDPANQALFAKASPETQAYAQDALSNGNFNEVQQIIGQEKKRGQVETNRTAVSNLVGPLSSQAKASPEEQSAANALLQSDNPFQSIHYLQGIANRNKAASTKQDNAAMQLASSQEQNARYNKAILEQSGDPATKQTLSIQSKLQNNGFSDKDIDLDPKEFATKFKLTGAQATAVQKELKDAQPSWLMNQARAVLNPLVPTLVDAPKPTDAKSLVDHVVQQNTTPEAIQAENDRKAQIDQSNQEVKAAMQAKQSILGKRAGGSAAAPQGDAMIKVQTADGRTGSMPLSQFNKAKKADPGLKVIR